MILIINIFLVKMKSIKIKIQLNLKYSYNKLINNQIILLVKTLRKAISTTKS